jgi:hypothetical protein
LWGKVLEIRNMEKTFKIVAGYQWEYSCGKETNQKNEETVAAIKKIVEVIQNHVESRGLDVKIDYSRLRASAGRNVLSSINKKINESQVAIFDITLPNRNVFLELGIALARAERDSNFSVYLIKNVKNLNGYYKPDDCEDKNWILGIPSDLMGFFVSRFKRENKKSDVVFDDNGSLYMSILRDITGFINENENENIIINEIEIANEIKLNINEVDV